ncbi:MAG: non-homologous end-joining DNA ligase [Streptosporangiaceae bacterium]
MSDRTVTLGRITVELSNTGKIFFPGEGITKGDLIGYYQAAAGRMLPFLRGRPLTMVRYPDGIGGQRFFQKNAPGYFPDWVSRVEVAKQDGTVCHVTCENAATIVYLANQGCIEIHEFLSRADRLDQPDQFVLDLDPPGLEQFNDARRAALLARDLLEGDLGLPTYPRTTGGTGLHVHVPLAAGPDFDTVRAFARRVASVLAARDPDLITVEQRKASRGGRVYADIMRNAYAQTVVAPYSVRARPGAPVSVPLHWDEVGDPRLDPGRFSLAAMSRRLADTEDDDPWAGFGRRRHGLSRMADRLAELAGTRGAY